MNRFIRYFNQNRVKIIIAILIVAFIIILIQAINHILKQSQTEEELTESVIQDSSRPVQSVITGEELTEETTDNNLNVIGQFVGFCNNQEYENAYNLLSQDCKDAVYSTLNSFVTDYCNKVFTTNMSYNLELWYNASNAYTYRILYFENNILSTGNINPTNNIEDFITVTESEDGYKLNINNFIERETINKSQNIEGTEITITINDRYIYRSYERYTITVRNNTDKTILLSEGTNGNDICLVDSNEVEYDSIINEVSLANLELTPGVERTLDIRFYKMYNLYRTINSISFKNIILDKNTFEQDAENTQRLNINIDI